MVGWRSRLWFSLVVFLCNVIQPAPTFTNAISHSSRFREEGPLVRLVGRTNPKPVWIKGERADSDLMVGCCRKPINLFLSKQFWFYAVCCCYPQGAAELEHFTFHGGKENSAALWTLIQTHHPAPRYFKYWSRYKGPTKIGPYWKFSSICYYNILLLYYYFIL